MKRIFSFALVSIWKELKPKNINLLINFAQKLDISGVEIIFASKEELYSFELSENNKSWLRNLDYVTIHAPFRLIRRAKNKREVIKQLNILSRLYDDIRAKNIIIHPTDLPPSDILKKYKFNVSIENLRPKRDIHISDLRKILDKYPKIGLCLDVSHAYLYSKHETGRLINAFKNRISQIHLSGTYRNKCHQSLRKVTKNFLFSIQPLKKLDVPIVIEEDFRQKSLKFVKEEIKYIKILIKNL